VSAGVAALEIGIHRGQRGKIAHCTEVVLDVLPAHNNRVSRRITHFRLDGLVERPHPVETLRSRGEAN
jgi:hypothetical protein